MPTRGRAASAVDAAVACGAETIQIFASNPRSWAPPTPSPGRAGEFAERRAAEGIGPVFVHTSYLVNIASPDPGFRRRSVELARREMDAAAALGADGIVVHAGAGGAAPREAALERAAASVLRLVEEVRGPEVLLELTAGGAGTVASTIPQAAELLRAVGPSERVRLCLDTCHLFAAGYPLDTPEGAARTLAELRTHRLTRRLRLVHANDSREPRGSRLDRHEHLGRGRIGAVGLRAVLRDPAVRRCAVLVETPGTMADHARNVAALRRLAAPV